MDEHMIEALRKSRIFLLENVIIDELLDHVIAQDIFSNSMLEYIKAGQTRTEQIRRLLDYLRRRPHCCFHKFLTALKDSGQKQCADVIIGHYVHNNPIQITDPSSVGNKDLQSKGSIDMMEISSSPVSVGEGRVNSLLHPPQETFPFGTSLNYGFSNIIGGPVLENIHSNTPVNTPVQESSSNPEEYSNSISPSSLGVCASGASHLTYISSLRSSLSSAYEEAIRQNQANVYEMNKQPRGLVLVLNNENFQHMSKRNGSTEDMKQLHDLFKFLGFLVSHEKDKTAYEMLYLLRKFSQMEVLSDVNALTVVILSHGGQNGVIFGTDGMVQNSQPLPNTYVTDDQIRDIFSARNCPRMAHKPKLILIQACRGGREDIVQRHDSFQTIDGNIMTLNRDGGESRSYCPLQPCNTAEMADLCLIHSTVSGYVSYRFSHSGSPFIKILADTMKKNASNLHLMDIMTEVNRNLAACQLPGDVRTIPSTTNTLTKCWYFNPPLV